VVLLGLGSLIFTSRIRDRLVDGSVAMSRGKAALLAGDAPEALRDFAVADTAFESAGRAASGPVAAVVRSLPILGRSADTVNDLSGAGVLLAHAGSRVAQAVDSLPNGLGALAPTGGRVPLQHIPPLAGAVSGASELAHQALRLVEAAPNSLLLGPVGGARARAIFQLSSLASELDTAARVLHGLPAFLGANGARTYFFGAADPAELRGSLGLIGAYSILTVDHGAFRFSPFRPTNALPDLRPSEVKAPSPEFARNYNQFGGAGFWKNISMSPDFPTVARAIEATYETGTGNPVDGVIVADPFALQALLTFTGPEPIPQLHGVSVNETNVVDFITNEAFTRFASPAARQRVLGAVAQGVFLRFLERAGAPASVRVLAKAAAAGHLAVHTTDPTFESGLAATPVGGTFAAPDGDFLSVVQNNGAGAKIDFYEDRSVSYAVHLEDGGTAQTVASVELTNHAPTSGPPPYVIGPFPGVKAQAGENIPILNLYCAPGCSLETSTRDGHPTRLRTGSELGHPFFQDYFHVPSGATSSSTYRASLPDAWEGNTSGGSYRLTFANQVTIRPTHLSISVQVPPGMHVTGTSVPMEVDGGLAVWEGVPGRRLDLRVDFQPSLPLRLWRDVGRIFSKPVIHT
jgi:hypothetical protein